MNIPCFSNPARAAILCLALFGSTGLYAAQDQNIIEPATGGETLNLNDLSTSDALRLAYYVLLPGNHNYHGHRGNAMTAISSAAQAFNLELKERGQGKEDQKKSDSRLVLAQRLLEPLRARLSTEEQKPVFDQVEKALESIALALKSRGLDEQAQPLKPSGSDQ